MNDEHYLCRECDRGCAARHTEEKTEEEVAAGPYLLFAAVAIVILSLFVKWLL